MFYKYMINGLPKRLSWRDVDVPTDGAALLEQGEAWLQPGKLGEALWSSTGFADYVGVLAKLVALTCASRNLQWDVRVDTVRLDWTIERLEAALETFNDDYGLPWTPELANIKAFLERNGVCFDRPSAEEIAEDVQADYLAYLDGSRPSG